MKHPGIRSPDGLLKIEISPIFNGGAGSEGQREQHHKEKGEGDKESVHDLSIIAVDSDFMSKKLLHKANFEKIVP
jgi:hypothetical protein